MKLRRALLLAPMLVLLWCGVASAQTTPCPIGVDVYNGEVCPSTSVVPPTTVPPEGEEEEVEAQGGEAREADLARTGADNIWPLIQAAIVLLGGGTLLVLVARRRRLERRATT